MSEWKAICTVDEIPRLGARRFQRAKGPQVALFRTADDRVFALLDSCPHKAGPLSQGIVFGDSVACPLHGWTIGLSTGCAREPDLGSTPRFEVRIEGAQVMLKATELESIAIDVIPIVAGPCAHAHA